MSCCSRWQYDVVHTPDSRPWLAFALDVLRGLLKDYRSLSDACLLAARSGMITRLLLSHPSAANIDAFPRRDKAEVDARLKVIGPPAGISYRSVILLLIPGQWPFFCALLNDLIINAQTSQDEHHPRC